MATALKRSAPTANSEDDYHITYAEFDDLSSDATEANDGDALGDTLAMSGGDLGPDGPQDFLMSGSSIEPELPCDVCGQTDRENIMVLCDGCKHGLHIDCLDPPLHEGYWLCDACISPTGRDITEDRVTLQFLATSKFPAAACKKEKTRIRARANRFSLVGGQLLHTQTSKPIHAIADRVQHLQDCHGIGHFGIAKTLHITQNHFWWHGMTEQVKAALLDCRECQTMLSRFDEPKEPHPVAVKGICNTVGIDLIGPVQISAKGNRYIITCVHYLTKNVEARAVPNKASYTKADFFWEDIICRYGNVATVISDRGGELSGSFEELLDRCFIDHRLTSPHHPHSNGLTERFNETLTIALRQIRQQAWQNG